MNVRFGGSRRMRIRGPLGCLFGFVMFVCITAFTLGLLATVFGAMRSADVVQQAVTIAQRDTGVVQSLGEPIELGWFISGSISTSGNSGEANITIPISGPNGKGSLYASAYKNNTGWHYMILELTVNPNGPVLDLLKE